MAKAKKAEPAEARIFAVTCERGLNLRDAPGGKVIVILPFGHEVICEAGDEALPEWIEVHAGDGVCGWAMSEYLGEVL